MVEAQIGLVGYCAALLAFAALGLYLRPASFDWQAPELRVRVACFGTALWAAVCAVQAYFDVLTVSALLFVDAVQLALWLLAFARFAELQNQGPWLRRGLIAGPAVVVIVTAVAALLSMQPQADVPVSGWAALLALLQPLIGVLAIEQIYRNAGGSAQLTLRWLFLGVGLMLAAHLFLLAEDVATQSFSTMVWHARGFVFIVAAFAIYKGLRGIGQNWGIGLFVSRQVVFYTTSFLLIGIYLILMSIGSRYLKDAAGSLGVVVQAVFIVALAGILLVLVFSNAIRRRLMVFFATHFYRNRYDYRIEWLRFVQTLSSRSAQGNLQESAIRAVCQIVESSAGRLWLIDEAGKRFLHAADWPATSAGPPGGLGIDATAPLLEFVRRSGWVVDLAELRSQRELYDNTEAPEDLQALGADAIVVPLLHVDSLYGLLLLRRPPVRSKLHFEDRDLLKMVGRHLAAHLWQADIDRRLANSKQFEAYNRMTAFVMHDLKNLTAQLQLVVTNAAKHKRNPDFVDDAIATISHSVDRMGRLLAALAQDARSSGARAVSLADIARRVALRAGARQPVPTVVVHSDATVTADPEQLSMVLEHVLRNAQDATPETGEVVIDVADFAGGPQISVRDSGAGMDDTFVRERLFRPFDTTKGARGMGIGAYQAREYLRSLGGDVRVESRPGAGTTFTLVFPHG